MNIDDFCVDNTIEMDYCLDVKMKFGHGARPLGMYSTMSLNFSLILTRLDERTESCFGIQERELDSDALSSLSPHPSATSRSSKQPVFAKFAILELQNGFINFCEISNLTKCRLVPKNFL
jgi:hypothetical protein